MAGNDGRGGAWRSWGWRHRKATGSSNSYSISSSSSGTVSTAYSSSGSHPSSTEPVMRFDFDDDFEFVPRERETGMEAMVQEFFGASCSINSGDDVRVLRRLFTELGVGWVLCYDDSASAGELDHISYAGSWIRAFNKIVETIRLTRPLFADRGAVGLGSISEEEPEAAAVTESQTQVIVPDQFQFARFTRAAMSKMLAFVDAIVSPNNSNTTSEFLVINTVTYKKLGALMYVRDALSKAVSDLQLASHAPVSAQVQRIQSDMISLLSANEAKVGEAIWSTMEEIRAHIPESMEDDDSFWGTQTPQGFSGIHKVTRSVMTYIRLLLGDQCWVLVSESPCEIACDAVTLHEYVPEIGDEAPSASVIIKTVHCLQEALTKKSESFPDPSLRFVFMINNTYFIWQQLDSTSLPKVHMRALTQKIEHYMKSYLDTSWALVSSCLLNPAPLCFRRSYSLLPKFESEFQKMYTSHKLWKVPDPELRKRLRKAIIERVAPGYREYLEDNNITTPRITPKELEEMLQELFEG